MPHLMPTFLTPHPLFHSQHNNKNNNYHPFSTRRIPHLSLHSPSTSKRGFRLLRSDLHHICQLLQLDHRSLLPTFPPLKVYNITAINTYCYRHPFPVLFRAASVALPFISFLFLVRKWDKWYSNPNTPTLRAQQLKKLLTWAGPTFLKIGQAVGNRPDLVGPIYAAQLQQLVDNVGCFDSQLAVQIVKEELKIDNLQQVFQWFEQDAVASASLGQVHRARLKNGDMVAIKVQRPAIERDAALDLFILRKAAVFVKKRFKLRSDLVGIIDEFGTRLWQELDYISEATNCERFEKLYTKQNQSICVPKIYNQLTTKKVLCMQWIDGDKAPWTPSMEAKRLIRLGVQCSLQQLLDEGFVHADPHTGNLLRTKQGKLCYLDFGMCVQVPSQVKYDLIAAIVRLINRDYQNLAPDFIKLGFLPSDADTQTLTTLLADAFGDAATGGGLSDLSFSKLADNLSGVAYKTPIRIPVFFTLIIRSLTILEGFALQIDSNFKIVDEAYPYVVERILTEEKPVFGEVLKGILIDEKSGRVRWDRLESLIETRTSTLREENNHNNNGINTSKNTLNTKPLAPYLSTGKGSEIPASPLTSMSEESFQRVLDFVLSERGKFLRNALQLELADTADAAQLVLANRISQWTSGMLPAPQEQADEQRVEKAITLLNLLSKRVPDLVTTPIDGDRQKRQLLLRNGLLETWKHVSAELMDRNSKRLLRKAVDVVFGPSQKPQQ